MLLAGTTGPSLAVPRPDTAAGPRRRRPSFLEERLSALAQGTLAISQQIVRAATPSNGGQNCGGRPSEGISASPRAAGRPQWLNSEVGDDGLHFPAVLTLRGHVL